MIKEWNFKKIKIQETSEKRQYCVLTRGDIKASKQPLKG